MFLEFKNVIESVDAVRTICVCLNNLMIVIEP